MNDIVKNCFEGLDLLSSVKDNQKYHLKQRLMMIKMVGLDFILAL